MRKVSQKKVILETGNTHLHREGRAGEASPRRGEDIRTGNRTVIACAYSSTPSGTQTTGTLTLSKVCKVLERREKEEALEPALSKGIAHAFALKAELDL
jgi:hypothetical protein